ncbi:MAG: FAD-binding oxidoreductase [Archaeoglobales archaeon]|nr:FAD-binding oxidoreductase [Archaeoglobales archaeon]
MSELKVAVIGGGIAGLSAAYFLAKSGAEVEVFEQRYLLYGASGRNSGGLTVQFNDEELIKLALRSLDLYDELQSEVKFNFLLRKDGYLKIANKNDEAKLESEASLLKKFGVKIEILNQNEVKELVPDINTKAFDLAYYFSKGGTVFPWPVIWGLARGCKALGVKVYDYTPATVVVENGSVKGVQTLDGLHKADFVINAAGAWSNEVSKSAGVELDNKIFKENICVTESLRPYLDPYIFDVSNNAYLSQSMRGEIVGGVVGREIDQIDKKGELDPLIRYAKFATNLIPKLKGLSVLRQWVGVYDLGKNGKPVIGFTKVKGFVQLNGFGRHGMSLGLAAGEKVAEMVLKK